jgi:molybdate transport system ATP-binding protein
MAEELICRCAKRFPSGFALDVDCRIPLHASSGGPNISVLFGPSGAGKTTLLRLIAGLEEPDTGSICFRGQDWHRGLPPQKRRVGFVFQDYALFPHLTVQANVAFGAPERARVAELMRAFALEELRARYPRQLSRGQQQRVALARALAAAPALLLLDEPLSALDAASRARTRDELRRTVQTAGAPCILVTHDRAEALALGHSMLVMIDGAIRQSGSVAEVFASPIDAAVKESLGTGA